MKKVKSIFTVIAFCATISFISNLKEKPLNGDMMAGISYAASSSGESAEFVAAMDVAGAVAIAGLSTGPVGWGFGLVAGL